MNLRSYGLKIFTNEVFLYLNIRYFSYFLQFINSLLLAKLLGQYHFGIWGILLLIIQYLNFSHLGIPYSTNLILSLKNKYDKTQLINILANSITITIFIGIIIIFTFLLFRFYDLNFFSDDNIYKYLLYVSLISAFNIWNELFINIYRANGKLREIGFYQIIIQVLIVPIFFITKDKDSILILLLGAYIIGNFLSMLLFILRFPYKLELKDFKISFSGIKYIIDKGFKLLIYNLSFLLILMSSRTVVSIFYTVESMGLYSFANSLTQAAFMFFSVINFAFFSKIVNKLQDNISNNETLDRINRIREPYILGISFVAYLTIFILPVLFVFLNEYSQSFEILTILLLSQISLNSCFGYSNVLIARGKELVLARISLLTVVINISLCFNFSYILNLPLIYIAISTFLSVSYYSFHVIYYTLNLLNKSNTIYTTMKIVYPLELLAPFIIFLIGTFVDHSIFYYGFAFILFLLLNLVKLKKVLKTIKQIIMDKHILKY